MMKKCLIVIFGLAVLATGLIAMPSHASALSGGDFRAGHIIDDSVFYNKNSMNTGDIQNFLNAKEPSCQSGYTCLKNYSLTFDSIPADAYCGAITGGNKSAANVIFDAAQACGINPQVLMVLLQKEQGLVASTAPGNYQYRFATGFCVYDDPSTEPPSCQGTDGFSNQVYYAARQFQKYRVLSNSFTYRGGQTSYINYSPNGGCGGTNVGIQNQATASLYNYTPYQPNQAALNNLNGSGDGCSAYGNRNFWRDFNDWFGPMIGDGYVLAIDASCVSGCQQYVVYGSIKQKVNTSQVKTAWNLPDQPESMDTNILNSFTTAGAPLDRLAYVRGGSVLNFMDNGHRYVVTNAAFSAWNFSGIPISTVPSGLFNLPSDAGYLGYTIKNPANSTYYMLDGANGSGQTILRPYASDTVRTAWEGSLVYTTISSDYFGTINSAIGGSLTSTSASCNGTDFQASAGGRYTESATVSSLFPSFQSVSPATFGRLAPLGVMSSLVQSVSSSTTYLVDSGVKHQILWPSALTAWWAPGQNITKVNDAFISTLGTGTSIGSYLAHDTNNNYFVIDHGTKLPVPSSLVTAYSSSMSTLSVSPALMNLYPTNNTATGFVQSNASSQIYLLDNSGQRRLIEWPDKAVLYGAYQSVITILSDDILNSIGTATSPSLFVTDGTTNYLLDDGKKAPVSAGVRADWGGLGTPQTFTDGTLNRFPTTTAVDNKLTNGQGAYFLIRGGASYGSADGDIAGIWGLRDAPVHDARLISNFLRQFMLVRFVRSTDNGDSRKFIINDGQWYSASDADMANVCPQSCPAMGLSPSLAPNTITPWPGPVVKDGSNNYYAIDGGTKRPLPAGQIRDQWTNFESNSIPTVSAFFLNVLPANTMMERAIKGSDPSVYSVENETKRHILYPDTYNRFYAPFTPVSDFLVNDLPTGQPI